MWKDWSILSWIQPYIHTYMCTYIHTIGSTRKSTNIQDFYPQESKQPNTECDDVGYSNSPVML